MNYDKRFYIRLGKVEERNRLPVEVAARKKLPPGEKLPHGKSCHLEKVATWKKLPPGKSCHPVKVAAR
jgi:hypothetical protein